MASSGVYKRYIEEEVEREVEEAAEGNSKNFLVSSVDINMRFDKMVLSGVFHFTLDV